MFMWFIVCVWLCEKFVVFFVEIYIDVVGNFWFMFCGKFDCVFFIGGYIDFVLNGGWFDGCLNLFVGFEIFCCIVV